MLSSFTFDETYALMNLTRVVMKIIDEVFAPLLPPEKIIRLAHKDVRQIASKASKRVMVRKTRTYVSMHYGQNFDLAYVASLVD